jgi:hypothetical protein
MGIGYVEGWFAGENGNVPYLRLYRVDIGQKQTISD